MAKSDLSVGESGDKIVEMTPRWVKFDFDNANANVLDGVRALADPTQNVALNPEAFGAIIAPLITGWSFEQDFTDPTQYGKLKLKEYRWLLKQFTDQFSSFFAENE